jgi:hypothetical protein
MLPAICRSECLPESTELGAVVVDFVVAVLGLGEVVTELVTVVAVVLFALVEVAVLGPEAVVR